MPWPLRPLTGAFFRAFLFAGGGAWVCTRWGTQAHVVQAIPVRGPASSHCVLVALLHGLFVALIRFFVLVLMLLRHIDA